MKLISTPYLPDWVVLLAELQILRLELLHWVLTGMNCCLHKDMLRLNSSLLRTYLKTPTTQSPATHLLCSAGLSSPLIALFIERALCRCFLIPSFGQHHKFCELLLYLRY